MIHRVLKATEFGPWARALLSGACPKLLRLVSTTPLEHQEISRTKRDNRIRYFVINNRPADALDLLERSLFRTPIPDPTQMGRFRYLKLPPSSVCNKVIDSAACSTSPTLVTKATELANALQLQEVGILPRTAGSLVSNLAATGSMEKGLNFLDNWLSKSQGLVESDNGGPSVEVSYVLTCALEAAARCLDPEAVTAVLGRMADVGMSPQPHSIPLLIQCFMKRGLIDTAYDIMKWMKRSGLSPTIQCFTALLTVPSRQFSRGPRVKPALLLSKAKHMYAELKEEGVRANLAYYHAFLSLCGHARDVSCAKELWADMTSHRDLSLDVRAYNTMIDVCGKCGDENMAYSVYLDLQKSAQLKPDASTISKLLNAIRKSPLRIDSVWADALRLNIPLDLTIWRTYIGIILERSKTEGEPSIGDIIALLETADDSVAPCAFQIAIMSAAHVGDTESVKEYAEAMRARRLCHTLGTVTAMLTARSQEKSHQSSGDCQKFVRWKTRMFDAAPSPTFLSINPDSKVLDALMTFNAVDGDIGVHEPSCARPSDESLDAQLVQLGMLCVDGKLNEAFDLYEQLCAVFMVSSHALKFGWMLHALLAASRCASSDEEQRISVLRTISLSRRLSKDCKKVWWWDAATQRSIIKFLIQFPDTAPMSLSLAPHHDEGERIPRN